MDSWTTDRGGDSREAALFRADCRELLPLLPDGYASSVVTDPPYEIGFMGRAWDSSGVAYDPEVWRQCLRVLKPGGHLIAFGGTRTYHRMACAIEDAGFEVRDSLHWIYGSGFPHGMDVGKAIDKAAGAEREVTGSKSAGQSSLQRVSRVEQGYRASLTSCTPEDIPVTAPATDEARQWAGWNTALKPAHEPVILARKPLSGKTVAANVLKHGTSALNVDGCRVGTAVAYESRMTQSPGGVLNANGRDTENGNWIQKPNDDPAMHEGRWPPNVLLTHCADCAPAGTRTVATGTAVQRNRDGNVHNEVYGALARPAVPDAGYASPDGTEEITAWDCAPGCPVAGLDAQSGVSKSSGGSGPASGKVGVSVYRGGYAHDQAGRNAGGLGDTGGASRFFPQFEWSPHYDLPFFYGAKAGRKERPRLADGTQHSTVKPLALMRWIVRLVTPPGGIVLDPFCGTGATLQAALLEGFPSLGCDDWDKAIEMARLRLDLGDDE